MAMMQQECGWFDEEAHSSAALSARLTGDAGNLQSVGAVKICIIQANLNVTFACISGDWLSTQCSSTIDINVRNRHHYFDDLFSEISSRLPRGVAIIIGRYYNREQVGIDVCAENKKCFDCFDLLNFADICPKRQSLKRNLSRQEPELLRKQSPIFEQ